VCDITSPINISLTVLIAGSCPADRGVWIDSAISTLSVLNFGCGAGCDDGCAQLEKATNAAPSAAKTDPKQRRDETDPALDRVEIVSEPGTAEADPAPD
jgi:hypothetical protein